MAPRTVSVFGATGLQGSSVVNALLKDGTFTPRAITRNPDSEAALKLKESGVEVVKGDSLDKASLGSALRGSEAVFAVTVGPDEVAQGKNIIDAAKTVGVKFLVFSSLPSLAKISGGKYPNCPNYEEKAVVEEYLKSSGLAHASLHLGSFLENFWKFGMLRKTDTGLVVGVPIYGPTDRDGFTWVGRDVPVVALALLKQYTDSSKNISGKSYPIINATITYSELAAITSKGLGVEVPFFSAPATGMSWFDEMFAAHAEYSGFYADAPVPNPDLAALGVKLGTIEEFVEAEVKPRYG